MELPSSPNLRVTSTQEQETHNGVASPRRLTLAYSHCGGRAIQERCLQYVFRFAQEGSGMSRHRGEE